MMIKNIIPLLLMSISSLIASPSNRLLPGFHHDDRPTICPALKDVLALHASFLFKDAIKERHKLTAYSITLEGSEGFDFCHVGHYCGGKIVTRFGRAFTDCMTPTLGEQYIQFASGDFLHSHDWLVEEIDGISFIVHDDQDFKVYSNNQTQFFSYLE